MKHGANQLNRQTLALVKAFAEGLTRGLLSTPGFSDSPDVPRETTRPRKPKTNAPEEAVQAIEQTLPFWPRVDLPLNVEDAIKDDVPPVTAQELREIEDRLRASPNEPPAGYYDPNDPESGMARSTGGLG